MTKLIQFVFRSRVRFGNPLSKSVTENCRRAVGVVVLFKEWTWLFYSLTNLSALVSIPQKNWRKAVRFGSHDETGNDRLFCNKRGSNTSELHWEQVLNSGNSQGIAQSHDSSTCHGLPLDLEMHSPPPPPRKRNHSKVSLFHCFLQYVSSFQGRFFTHWHLAGENWFQRCKVFLRQTSAVHRLICVRYSIESLFAGKYYTWRTVLDWRMGFKHDIYWK